MPIRKTIFVENGYYHVFNRGIERRVIFQDNQDYLTFLDILTYYLKFIKKSPLNALTRTGLVNTGIFQDQITLLAYCLMPTHFHILLQQKEKNSISRFMLRVGTTYSMYFNQRYIRDGSLYQGRFKANHITTDSYLLQSSKYIHRNPLDLPTRPGLVEYPWSSYQIYLKSNQNPYLPIHSATKSSTILDYFSSSNPHLSYSSFVEETPLPNWYTKEIERWIRSLTNYKARP